MENDTEFSRPRTNILFRQVVVPSWLQVILLGIYLCTFISLLIAHPLVLLVALAVNLVFVAFILNPLRRRAGQPTDTEYDAEVKAAPNKDTAIKLRWRQLRTYQVWHLIIVLIVFVFIVLDAVGVTTTP